MPGYRKLGRKSDHRKAMLRNLVTDLLREERIVTTKFRAKEASREAEKMISLAKRSLEKGSAAQIHAKRQAMAYIYDEDVVSKLFDDIAPRYEERNGGYTRILKLGPRRGDAAEEVFLELV